jgi:hypothetical protein
MVGNKHSTGDPIHRKMRDVDHRPSFSKGILNNLQAVAPFAAFTNGVVAIATLYVALIMIGPEVLMDRSLFVEMAINNPTPIFIQDVLKFISAACMSVLIITLFRRLGNQAVGRMRFASLAGFLSILLLLANAVVSLLATANAGEWADTGSSNGNELNQLIGVLAMASIFSSGLWYLLTSWTAIKTRQLSRGLNYTGLAIAALSLIPVVAIAALLVGVVWSFWLGSILVKDALPKE